jgi:hypothetical protein
MSAGTSQYRPPPPTIRVTPAISVNTAVEALGLVRSSVRARSESGAGVDIQPHWPHKNQGDTGDDAENDQFQTECPIRLPRVATRIAATSGIAKRTSVRVALTRSAGCFATLLAFTEIATNRSPINAPLAPPTTTAKLSQVSTTRRLSGYPPPVLRDGRECDNEPRCPACCADLIES